MTDDQTPRQFFRIMYPEFERPVFVTDRVTVTVLELSEGGVRLADCPAELCSAEELEGTLKLLSGEQRHITAKFLRTSGTESIFNGLCGIAYADMLAEQRYLIRKYGRKILGKR